MYILIVLLNRSIMYFPSGIFLRYLFFSSSYRSPRGVTGTHYHKGFLLSTMYYKPALRVRLMLHSSVFCQLCFFKSLVFFSKKLFLPLGQARTHGAVCDISEEDELQFVKHLNSQGVKNIEMESAGFFALCHKAGVKCKSWSCSQTNSHRLNNWDTITYIIQSDHPIP